MFALLKVFIIILLPIPFTKFMLQVDKVLASALPYGRYPILGPERVSVIGTSNTKIQKYRNTEIQKYRNTEIQKHRNTVIQKYNANMLLDIHMLKKQCRNT